MKEGMEKLRQISNTTRMIQSNEVAGKIREICKVGWRFSTTSRKTRARSAR